MRQKKIDKSEFFKAKKNNKLVCVKNLEKSLF